jgi:hypothetical protein
MNAFLDDFLVGLVLLAGFGYALYSLGPKALRTRLLMGLSWLLSRVPAVIGVRGLSQRLEMRATLKAKGACGGCDNCGSDSSAAKTAGGSGVGGSSVGDSGGEVRVPLEKIGRRR